MHEGWDGDAVGSIPLALCFTFRRETSPAHGWLLLLVVATVLIETVLLYVMDGGRPVYMMYQQVWAVHCLNFVPCREFRCWYVSIRPKALHSFELIAKTSTVIWIIYNIVSYRIVSYRIVSYRIVSYCILDERELSERVLNFALSELVRSVKKMMERTFHTLKLFCSVYASLLFVQDTIEYKK